MGYYVLKLKMKLPSLLNESKHWRTIFNIKKKQKSLVSKMLLTMPLMVRTELKIEAQSALRCPSKHPLAVVMTRLVRSQGLDPDDNLNASFKVVRDTIATFLRVGDGPQGPVQWRYAQRSPLIEEAEGATILFVWGPDSVPG